MIGQNELIRELNKINTIEELPKSIIICGKNGSGKHIFANMIAEKFMFETEVIDYELSLEILNELYTLTRPKLFIIDNEALKANKRIERFQNTLLKFIEEPPAFAWIILITMDKYSLLETIQNRCQIFETSPYTLEELQEIAKLNHKAFNDVQLEILETPGRIIETSEEDIHTIYGLCELILDNISKATPSNALTITKKFDIYNIDLFISVFSYVICQRILYGTFDKRYEQILEITRNLDKNLQVMNVNKTDLLDNYFLRIKQILS